MFQARLIQAALISGLVVLPASPVIAHAQFGGLVNRAKQAVRPDKPQPQASRNNVVSITSDNVAAYIRGNHAEKAEMKRLDSLRTLADNSPDVARQLALAVCRTKAMEGMAGTPEQRRADSARMMKNFASLDTVKMKKLAQAAQAGDAAAIAELQQITIQYAHRQATDPAAIAARERSQKQMEESMKQSAACDRSVPPVSAFAGPIANARAEMAKYGSQSSSAYAAHLSSVKLSAAGGMSPAEYAVLEERIRGYASSTTEPKQGFSEAELAVLRAHRTELSALTY
jgi:hypothetical protein